MNELQTKTKLEHPDIICITEAYPKNSSYENSDNQFSINGYDLLRTDGGRGIIIYTANHLIASLIETKTEFEESLWCNIKITKEHNIIFGGIYRSPSSDNDNNVLLPAILQEVTQIKHDHIIIAGDFNLKQIDWESRQVTGAQDSYQYKVFDAVNDLFLTETVQEPTRFRGSDQPSKLDWVLTENATCVSNMMINPPLGPSDHSLLSLDYYCFLEKDSSDDPSGYSYCRGNYDSMREELDSPDWIGSLQDLSAQQAWDSMSNKIIESFLSDREQRVVLGNQKSNWQPVTSGIPQGSVLGPILFTIFINDMPEVVESLMKLFADDAKIFKAIESFKDISVIQEDINKLLKWSTKWQLPLNINKFKCIHYGKSNPKHTYTIGNIDLANDDLEKDVGVHFDPSLEFRIHINKMISKANSRVGLIKKSFSKLSITNFKLLYKSLIRPILEYCTVIWFPLYKTDSQEIEKVQRRATKLVPTLKDLPYPERLKTLNLTTLAYRRNRTDMLQVYRIINKIDNIDFDSYFTYNKNNTRGHSQKIDKPRANTRLRLKSFSHRVINMWNSLPEETITSPSLNSFKNALEKVWENDPIKYIFE